VRSFSLHSIFRSLFCWDSLKLYPAALLVSQCISLLSFSMPSSTTSLAEKCLLLLLCLLPVFAQEFETYDDYLRSFQKDQTRAKETDRKAIFKRNMEYIRLHNSGTNRHSFSLRTNQFSDMSRDEIAALFPEANPPFSKSHSQIQSHYLAQDQLVSPARQLLAEETLSFGTPASSVNWADASQNPSGRSVVSAVQNQGVCGACWAFTAVHATEAAVRLSGHEGRVSLSVQELLDCDRNGTAGLHLPPQAVNNGCSGGNPIRAFR
jgi:cysteine peptidase B